MFHYFMAYSQKVKKIIHIRNPVSKKQSVAECGAVVANWSIYVQFSYLTFKKSNIGRLTVKKHVTTETERVTKTPQNYEQYGQIFNKRQPKLKTKADTPVPRCIALRQLHSGSWCVKKAQSHLAPVTLLIKGKGLGDAQVPSLQHLLSIQHDIFLNFSHTIVLLFFMSIFFFPTEMEIELLGSVAFFMEHRVSVEFYKH